MYVNELQIDVDTPKRFENILFFLFYLYIYPPDLQKSNRGEICRAKNYPNLFLKMTRYCYLLEIFHFLSIL